MVVVAVPAVVMAVATLAAFGGRWVWWLDVLANFRPQLLVVLLILGVLLMVGRWRRTGSAVLMAAAVNLAVVLPLFAGSPGESDPSRPGVIVMSFNLYSPNDQYGAVIDYIQQIDADLVFLHEASRPWELAMDAIGGQYRLIRPRSDDLIFGTLVLARGNLIGWESYGFATEEARAVEITVVLDGWDQPLKVLSTHPLAPTDGERAAIRDAQLGFAAGWAREQEGPFLVLGDMNATPWSWPFRRLEASTELRNTAIGFGLQASYPVTGNPLLRIPIDHVLHSPGLGVRDRRLGPALGSDHFPVVVELELRR